MRVTTGTAVLGAGALLLLSLAGCSTRRFLEIDSNPSGARIWVNGVLQEKPTPVEIECLHKDLALIC